MISSTDYVSTWKSKGLSSETIKPSATSDNSLPSALSYYGTKTSCWKQPNISYLHRTIVNIYIVYELGASSSHSNDPTLENCLFGAVALTKNADINKYRYSGYGNGFDRRSSSWFPSRRFGQNVLIFRADMTSSAHMDNKKKDILVLGKGPTQWLEYTLAAEKMYSINFTVTIYIYIFYLSLHYNIANSYLLVNGREIYKFKAKDSEIVAAPLCLRSISKDWSVDNIKKTGFSG